MTKISGTVIIRRATPHDMQAVFDLIAELASYEKARSEVSITVEELIHDGFTAKLFTCFVAEMEAKIVGMALFYPRYSTWKGRTIHLEDLVVSQPYRGQGIGKRLFDAVVAAAKKYNARRLEWAVLNWNKPALDFYNKINAHYDEDWFLAQLREQQLLDYKFD
jgi:GNAT superfamily N-acetyltransferase